MTLPEYALNYKECKTPDLRQFVVARSGEPASELGKAEAIKRLKLLDKSANIRFFEFSAEVRNIVYGYAFDGHEIDLYKPRWLRFNFHGNTKFRVSNVTAFLQTSKQAYQEGRQYIYDSAEFRIKAIYVRDRFKPSFHGASIRHALHILLREISNLHLNDGVTLEDARHRLIVQTPLLDPEIAKGLASIKRLRIGAICQTSKTPPMSEDLHALADYVPVLVLLCPQIHTITVEFRLWVDANGPHYSTDTMEQSLAEHLAAIPEVIDLSIDPITSKDPRRMDKLYAVFETARYNWTRRNQAER